MTRRIDQLAENDRPRERLLGRGAGTLSDSELLAVMLGRGTAGVDVLTLASRVARLLDERGARITPADLTSLEGMGDAKAASILAALEYARRRIKPEGARIMTTADLLPHIRHFADRKQEHFLCATLNGANELLNVRVISIGSVDRTTVHPREVYADALVDRATAIIVAHNHPSGHVEPSDHDVTTTHRLIAAGSVLGIELLDHVILGRGRHFSFREAGQIT